ncbi:hypothetical protein, partial [Bacillus clarus]|uniref:hypothetical protein n=1 Tax=Bacillus clarus TaxID=2338372 RepID=UPI001C702813
HEQLLAGLLALTGVLGIGEGHLFHHRKARRLVSGDFAKSGSLFQDFPKGASSRRRRHLLSVLGSEVSRRVRPPDDPVDEARSLMAKRIYGIIFEYS